MTTAGRRAGAPNPGARTNGTAWLLILACLVVVILAGVVGLVLYIHPSGISAAPGSSIHAPHEALQSQVVTADHGRARSIPAPRSTRELQEFDYGWFSVGYDNERRAGAWGRYDLDGPIVHRDSQPARPTFRTEPRSSPRVASRDYSNPGNLFERGHIVPSYAMWSRFGDEARKATFVMTNTFPQDEDLNGRLWEDLEDDIAGQVKGGQVIDQGYAGRLRNITVIAGPVYGTNSRSLPSGIPIPEATFHIIYDLDDTSGSYRVRAYLIPNQAKLSGPTGRYARSVRAIEEATGLDFMPGWGADADALELAPAATNAW